MIASAFLHFDMSGLECVNMCTHMHMYACVHMYVMINCIYVNMNHHESHISICERETERKKFTYGVAMMSRLLQNIWLFCRIWSLL